MRSSLFISMLAMALMLIATSFPVSATESSQAGKTHTEQQVGHTPKHQAAAEKQQPHEEHIKHDEPAANEAHGKHAETEQAGHKEYPKLAEGIHKIAYFAVGFIIFALIAVPIGAHLEQKKHPHTSS